MYKKIVHTALSVLVFIMGAEAALATTSSGSSGYNTPIVRSAFNFTAVVQDNGSIQMNWVPYAPEGFNYYKVVRSQTNSNPVYPDDGYILASSDTNLSNYVDNDPPTGKTYYRVCSIASPNRYCSAVITLNLSGEAVTAENPTTDTGTITPAVIALSAVEKGGYVLLTWAVNGKAPYGFKICKSSVNEEPTYPIIKGDAYQYLSDPYIREMKDYTVKADQTYYYRVCQYDGKGTCVTYSNSADVAVKNDGAKASNDLTTNGSITSLVPATLELKGTMGDSYVKLEWTINGDAPQGFKIAKSQTHENPTYPVMEGDDYKYLTDPAVRVYKDYDAKAGKTYYYRVCQYDGAGICVSYSNGISVEVPTTFTGGKEAEKAYETAVKSELKDIKSSPYKEAIQDLVNNKIVQGYTDGSFRPEITVNRAEFIKMILVAKYGKDKVGNEYNCFRDVKKDWYAPYVCFSKKKGVIKGYSDGNFKPSKEITLAEAAKVLAELYDLDVELTGKWYEGYVKALQNKNFVPSSVKKPEKALTRGEVAEMIWRVKENKADESSLSVNETTEGVWTGTGDYEGWAKFEKNGYSFYYPAGWYRGLKSYGWEMLSEEKDYIDNINTPNYMDVDTYVATYVANSNASSESALASKVAFAHPLISSENLTINGYPVLKRHFRAPAGTVVNGRTTGENENIIMYTYFKGNKVIAIQYFNAYGNESYGVDQFEKIASSFQ